MIVCAARLKANVGPHLSKGWPFVNYIVDFLNKIYARVFYFLAQMTVDFQ